MRDIVRIAGEMTQAGSLASFAAILAVGAIASIVFAERWAKDGASMTWAPWMQKKTPTTYRRLGYAYAILALLSAIGSLVSWLSHT